MSKRKKKKTSTSIEIELSLTGEDIISLLKKSKDYADCFEEDGLFHITITVPSGGDYSGLELIIGQDVDVIVKQTANWSILQ